MKKRDVIEETSPQVTCMCGGEVQTDITRDPPEGFTGHVMLHTMPYCADFDKLPPDEFMSKLLAHYAALKTN